MSFIILNISYPSCWLVNPLLVIGWPIDSLIFLFYSYWLNIRVELTIYIMKVARQSLLRICDGGSKSAVNYLHHEGSSTISYSWHGRRIFLSTFCIMKVHSPLLSACTLQDIENWICIVIHYPQPWKKRPLVQTVKL